MTKEEAIREKLFSAARALFEALSVSSAAPPEDQAAAMRACWQLFINGEERDPAGAPARGFSELKKIPRYSGSMRERVRRYSI